MMMDTELLFPELDFSSEKDQITGNIQNEIECLRCIDTMILSSNFDVFLFFVKYASYSF
jgi:hypothetical protein